MTKEIYTGHKLPDKSRWVARATLGGARLEPLEPPRPRPLPDKSLEKVRFSGEVYELMVRKKKHKNEGVRECIERLIREAPDVR
jgi:hypothetical protein